MFRNSVRVRNVRNVRHDRNAQNIFLEPGTLLGLPSGKHVHQSSTIPEIHQDVGSRKKISGRSDWVIAQNVDAALAVVVI